MQLWFFFIFGVNRNGNGKVPLKIKNINTTLRINKTEEYKIQNKIYNLRKDMNKPYVFNIIIYQLYNWLGKSYHKTVISDEITLYLLQFKSEY